MDALEIDKASVSVPDVAETYGMLSASAHDAVRDWRQSIIGGERL